jgi:hypothetical protein
MDLALGAARCTRLAHLRRRAAAAPPAPRAPKPAAAAHPQTPRTQRYTGYVQGLQEVFMKTPVMAQLETKAPPATSFLHTRTARPPVPAPHRVSTSQRRARGGTGPARASHS